ncbi:hypothetical protein HDU89_008669 [Geranomyces variabilis]|nr:hypothetical protein HDU89_008669 [Geranomyces variabilis]
MTRYLSITARKAETRTKDENVSLENNDKYELQNSQLLNSLESESEVEMSEVEEGQDESEQSSLGSVLSVSLSELKAA